MELSANQYVCPDGYGVERFLDEANAAGFRSVALTRAALAEMSATELRRAVDARDLAVTTLNSAGYFTWADVARRNAQDEENRRLIAAAAELGAEALCIITGGWAEQPDIAAARGLIAEGLAELDELAANAAVRLGLEPIHPKDAALKGCVNTLAQAKALVAPLQATGLIMDLFHSCWDPDLIGVSADPCVHVLQICNVTDDIRRSPRLDQGVLDVREVVKQIADAGFTGPVEFEIFAADHGLAYVAPILHAVADWGQG